MGACVVIAGPPSGVSIKLPGGLNISSSSSATQGVPNSMDPFQDLLDKIQPVLGAIKPVFDVIGFIIALMGLMIDVMKILGALLTLIAPGNLLSILFPIDPLLDANGDPVKLTPAGPEIPDVAGLLPSLIDGLMNLICFALRLVGLIPQLSGVFTVKDSLVTAMQFTDATMAQVNSLSDIFADLAVPDTGNPLIDNLLQCARDNAETQLAHKLGPLSDLAPVMSLVGLIAAAASQPLPRPVVIMAELAAKPPPEGFGLIPFPSPGDRDAFLQLLGDMATNGLPFEIPDFSNLADIGEIQEKLRTSLGPIVPIIDLLMVVVDKLTKC